ncbi:MAG: carbohydrate-binding domain-containing protein [Bacteroidaceae bacterium]|nr:carbohydrate-binding domain-containing protein [Bacteroidaceae bacterium]
MKKIILLLAFVSAHLGMQAQELIRIWQNGESTKVALSSAGNMVYSNNGATLTIAGVTYQTAAIDSITLVHQVAVTYSEGTANVIVPQLVANDITVQKDGANVTITNNNVSNEIEFVLKGSASNGSFTYNGSYKTTLRLNGLSLTSQKGAALDILCGKRVAMVLEDGTTNTLADYAKGSQKASLYCKGHLEVEGSGTLNVTGNLTHAIKTKEYLELKKGTGTINIVSAAGDAIHAGQYYKQNGGTVNITSTTQADGIQVEQLTLDDDKTPDPDKENNGQIFIKGGTLNVEITHEDCEALKSDGDISITGGTFNIAASGNGSRGIQTDSNMVINEDDNSTNIIITATGGVCTNEADADDPHRCMGIKVDGDLTINAGTVNVKATGKKSRSIRVGGKYNVSDNANVTVSPAAKVG